MFPFAAKTNDDQRNQNGVIATTSVDDHARLTDFDADTARFDAALLEAIQHVEVLRCARGAVRSAGADHVSSTVDMPSSFDAEAIDRLVADHAASTTRGERLNDDIARAVEKVRVLQQIVTRRPAQRIVLRNAVRAEIRAVVSAQILRRCEEVEPLLRRLAPIVAEMVEIGVHHGGSLAFPGLPVQMGRQPMVHLEAWLKAVDDFRRQVEGER